MREKKKVTRFHQHTHTPELCERWIGGCQPVICDHNYARQEYLRSIYCARMAKKSTKYAILCRHLVDLYTVTYKSYARTRVCIRTLYDRRGNGSMCQINELNQKLETIMFV